MTDNKLIAEFMGYPPMTDAVDDRTIAYDVGGSVMNINNTHNENDDNVFHPDDMKFHISWDWLMPVVLKCKESVDYCSDDNALEYHNIEDEMLSQLSIEDTYQAVVKFIKIYNNDTI